MRKVYFGSSADHTVRALDAGGGEEQGVFYRESWGQSLISD